jgi:hypothetical protein
MMGEFRHLLNISRNSIHFLTKKVEIKNYTQFNTESAKWLLDHRPLRKG